MAKELELMSKNYEEMQIVPGAAKDAGEFATYSEVNGFHLVDFSTAQYDAGESTTLITKAEKVRCIKTNGETWVSGQEVAWVTGTSKVSNVIGSDILIGHVIEAVASAVLIGWISFDGMLANLIST